MQKYQILHVEGNHKNHWECVIVLDCYMTFCASIDLASATHSSVTATENRVDTTLHPPILPKTGFPKEISVSRSRVSYTQPLNQQVTRKQVP